jgi:hypothetical protein
MQNVQPQNVLLKVLLMQADRVRAMQEMLWETAVYLGTKLEPIQLREYAKELLEANLSEVEVDYALRQIRKQPNRKRWGVPMPADIIDFINPQPNDNDRANEIAAVIQYCYGEFGYNNAAKAQAYMGEDAWTVVVQKGGWLKLCGSSDTDPATEFAQLRDLARSVVRRAVQTKRVLQLQTHRAERSNLLSEPKLSPQQCEENKQRIADLVGNLFTSKKTESVPS